MTEEKKTKRGNLLFTPSVYKDSQILADIDGVSLNEYLHDLAKKEIEKRQEEVNAWKEVRTIKSKIINNMGSMTIEEQQQLSDKMKKFNDIIGK